MGLGASERRRKAKMSAEELAAEEFFRGDFEGDDDSENDEDENEDEGDTRKSIVFSGNFSDSFDFNIFRNYVNQRDPNALQSVSRIKLSNDESAHECAFLNFPLNVVQIELEGFTLNATQLIELCGSHVKKMVLERCDIDEFPDFTTSTNLKILEIEFCHFHNELGNTGGFPLQMKELLIRVCNLRSIPIIRSNKTLTELTAYNNRLTAIPLEESGQYPNLTRLSLNENNITDMNTIGGLVMSTPNNVNLSKNKITQLVEIQGNAHISYMDTQYLAANAENVRLLQTAAYADILRAGERNNLIQKLRADGKQTNIVKHQLHKQILGNEYADVGNHIWGFVNRTHKTDPNEKRKRSPDATHEDSPRTKTSRAVGGKSSRKSRRASKPSSAKKRASKSRRRKRIF